MTESTPSVSEFYAHILTARSLSAQKLLMRLLTGDIAPSASELVDAIKTEADKLDPTEFQP